MKKIFLIIIASILIISAYSCNQKKAEETVVADTLAQIIPELTAIQKDSIVKSDIISKLDTFPTINYQLHKIKNRKDLNKILREWGYRQKSKAKKKAFLTLNRKETRYLRIGDTIVIPDTAFTDMKYFSVFPQYYHEAKDLKKLIVVSNPYQSYACYENGYLVRFAACNSGKERTPTFPGRYALVWRDRLRRSSLDSNWVLPYTFNFHKAAGNAFHKFDMPGYAASHSCVRQFMSDAKWLYGWGKGIRLDTNRKLIPMSGTPVIVLDVPDYKRKRGGSWFDIPTNKSGIIKLDYDPMEVEEALIPYSQIPLASRYSLRNINRYKYAEDTLRAKGIIAEGVRLIETRNFNKERREKKRKAFKDSVKKVKIQLESDKTDMELIKSNLENLNKSSIKNDSLQSKTKQIKTVIPPNNDKNIIEADSTKKNK